MTATPSSRPSASAPARLGRARRLALLAHRWVGLFLAVFLVVAGVTGTFLAFYEELDSLLNPELFQVPVAERDLPNLDGIEVAERVERSLPAGRHFRSAQFDVHEGRTATGWAEESPGVWREWFVSPKTGRVVGKRTWGDISEGKKNLMPFIYRLHYSLGLGEVGNVLFGVVALLWTIDCFVGAYLTFPAPSPGLRRRPLQFAQSWLPAWKLRTKKLFSFVFTWHRASGLWLWALLLVFAWSAVGFNLRPVYSGVMQTFLGMRPEGHEMLPHLEAPFPEPRLGLREARRLGRLEMAREARERGFGVVREIGLYYADDHGAWAYVVASSLDISEKEPRTEIYLDGQTGRVLGFSAPSGISAGNTLSAWLAYLHMGAVFGLWYRVVVGLIGLAVAALSVTGVWIWWRKRGQRRAKRGGSRPPGESEELVELAESSAPSSVEQREAS